MALVRHLLIFLLLGSLFLNQCEGALSESQVMTAFRKRALSLLNNMRIKNNVNPLRMNDDLNRSSQEWADYMAQSGYFDIGVTRDSVTQVISRRFGQFYTAETMLDDWYNDNKIRVYLFNNTITDFGVGKAFFKTRHRWFAAGEFM